MDQFEQYEKGQLLHDRYLKINDISEGSYGLVSVAKDIKNNNELVAVKYIYPINYKKDSKEVNGGDHGESDEDKHSKSIINQLLDEANKEIKIHKILGDHPNISKLYDHFDSCLVLEYCSRGDLYEAIYNGQGPSTIEDIKDVFQQICNGLKYCHSNQVYHRDLKPENILITQDWDIKICDWGLATTKKIVTDEKEFDIGSERYMAPELFDSSIEYYDASKIDIWSIGIILLTLIFHKNPFKKAEQSDKSFQRFSLNRESLFDIFSTMSGDLFSVLRFCLTIDPSNRDLDGLMVEMESLRYFTIDDEYKGSDDDYDDDYMEEEDEYDEEEDEEEDEYNSSSLEEAEKLKPRVLFDEPKPLKFNSRADALLSTNTDLKPIPINKKVFRSRKPLKVASFAPSSNMNNHFDNSNHYTNQNNKHQLFKSNREDFFTPKSIFNHYMDKYGEQKFNKQNKKHNHQPRRDKRKTWKKNYKKSSHNNNNDHGSHQNNDQFSNQRRKSRSYSTSKLRRNLNGSGISNNNCFSGSINSINNPIQSSFHPLSHPNNIVSHHQNVASNLSNSGKYVPPYLRSPTLAKSSPVMEPAGQTEELDQLLEVFHLEDDFDSDSTTSNNNNTNNSNNIKHHTNGGSSQHYAHPHHVNRRQLYGDESGHDSDRSQNANSINGLKNKYIPPFRRNSNTTTTHTNLKPISNFLNKSNEKRHNNLNHGYSDEIHGINSMPIMGSEWTKFKKNWSDYESYE